jgi:hypothetical protein
MPRLKRRNFKRRQDVHAALWSVLD